MMGFERLISPFNEGNKRPRKDIARALLDITPEASLWKFTQLFDRREAADDYRVVKTLAYFLERFGGLHKIRLLSRAIARTFAAAGALDSIFHRLYVSPMYADPGAIRSKAAFVSVAYGCRELVITMKEFLGNHQYPPCVVFKDSSLGKVPLCGYDNDWVDVFRYCPNITTLTVATDSCSTGRLWNRTSSALTALRTAFEEVGLTGVHTLRLAPMDMIYIGQFRSNGPAFGNASPLAEGAWSRITQLEMQVLPPTNLSRLDRIQTAKLFNAWLQSLAPHLKLLKLCYLGREGQHPFALLGNLDILRSGQPDVWMPALQELWLGYVKDVEDGIYLLTELAPRLESYEVLVRAHYVLKLLAFDKTTPLELWKTIQIKNPKPPRTQSLSSTIYEDHTWSTGQTHAPGSASPVSPIQKMVLNRSTSTTSKSSTTPFHNIFKGHDRGSRQKSLPNMPKLPRKRTSSIVSSIFSLKARPKSDPNRLPIKLIGETPRDQIPPGFLGDDTHYLTLRESMARYGNEGLNDLSRPPELRLAELQRIGQFDYHPGSLFQAGSGARLPEAVKQASAEVDGRKTSNGSGNPTPDQIRRAFENIGLHAGSPGLSAKSSREVLSPGHHEDWWQDFNNDDQSFYNHDEGGTDYDGAEEQADDRSNSRETIDRGRSG